jgi:hypothetical protein
MVVFGVGLEVGSELVDTGRQKCHLHFGAACVPGLASVVFDDSGFDTGCNHVNFLWVVNLRQALELPPTCAFAICKARRL